MTEVAIEKVHAGFRVDGLSLLRGNCGCGGLTGPGGAGVGDCCQTYSIVKKDGNVIIFFAKGTTPNTKNNFKSGYRVKKGAVEVDVMVYDTTIPRALPLEAIIRRRCQTGRQKAGRWYSRWRNPWQIPGWRCPNGARVPSRVTGPTRF